MYVNGVSCHTWLNPLVIVVVLVPVHVPVHTVVLLLTHLAERFQASAASLRLGSLPFLLPQ